MTMQELEEIMILKGIVIRAIPMMITGIYETRHASRYPNGVVKYLESYDREMLVVETVPENAGKFMITTEMNTSGVVRFFKSTFTDNIYKGRFFISLEEAVQAVKETM